MGNKKQRKNRKVVKMSDLYDSGKLKNNICPKCGSGVVMAEHSNRRSCGKCGYTEFKK